MPKNISRFWSTCIQHCSPTLRYFSPTITPQQRHLWKRVSFNFSVHFFKLSVMQQRAISSFYLMQYLRQFDTETYLQGTKSLRQLLFDQQTLKNYILESLNRGRVTKMESFSQIGIQDSTIKQVVEGFGFEKGALVDTDIWRQFRFKQAITSISSDQKKVYITLNPQHHSNKIINHLMNNSTPFIVYGEKGTGKSFAYLLYDYISKSMIDYKFNRTNNQLFQELVPTIQFGNIKKLIYFSLKEMNSFQAVAKIFLKQISEIDSSSLNADGIKDAQSFNQFFQDYLKLLQKVYYQQNRIKVMIIIDEANYYYSLFRLYKNSLFLKGAEPQNFNGKQFTFTQNPLPNRDRLQELLNLKIEQLKDKTFDKLKFEQKLLFFSMLLQKQKDYGFLNIILNSSQQILASVITEWNKNITLSFYDIRAHGRIGMKDLNISYSKNLLQPKGQLSLYHIFWFEIERNLHIEFQKRKNLKKAQQFMMKESETMRQLKQIFLRTFKIIINNDKKPNQFCERWLLDIQHFNVRQRFDKQQDPAFLQLIMHMKENMKEKQAQIQNIFKAMKEEIQNLRRQQIREKGFQKYLQKSTNEVQFSQRLFILMLIRKKAIQWAKTNSAKNILFSFNYLTLLGTKKNSSYVSTFEQLTSQLNIGFTDKKTHQITFSMDPSLIAELTDFLVEQYTFMQYVRFVKVLKRYEFAPGLAGTICDIGFHQVLKSSHFDLELDIYGTSQLTKEDGGIFQIKQSISHERSNNEDAQQILQSLSSLLDKSFNNKRQQYFASYPIHQVKGGVYQYRTNNGVYDLAINRYNTNQNKHQLTLIDITMAKINHKLALEKYTALQLKLNQLARLKNNDKQISLTYIIMAPQGIITKYIKRALETKQYFNVVNAKYRLKLGAFSQSIMKNLTLYNLNQLEKTGISDFFKITIKECMNHFEKTYDQQGDLY